MQWRVGALVWSQDWHAGQSWLVRRDRLSWNLFGRYRPLEKIQRDSGTDWILCELYADQFRGFGGPSNLGEILDIFLSWAE